jgi:hypothetical protein
MALALLASASAAGTSRAQALRTCVDRWNQGNMLGWGPARAGVAMRRLRPAERAQLGESTVGRSLCVVLIRVDSRSTWVCDIGPVGAYWCGIRHEPMHRALTNANATIDRRGVMKLDVPLGGTHPTPPLAWQRYPHVDGYIHPWTPGGKLRHGLKLDQPGPARHFRGACWRGSEIVFDKSALRCYSDVQFDPCFGRGTRWNRPGGVAACSAPGWTTFTRFAIVRRR